MRDKKLKNPDAFPVPYERWSNGMTLRDYFAAKVLQGMFTESMIEVSNDVVNSSSKTRSEWFAEQAYNFADAMIKQREL